MEVRTLPLGDWPALQRRYLFYEPEDAVSAEGGRLPLLLSLHGAGERGDDPDLLLLHGIPKRLSEREDLPFVVVAPQCPADERWAADSLARFLDEVERGSPIDPDRIYVTGLSMGGSGTWSLALAQPHRFAAIAPICGRGDPTQVSVLRHLPVWVFHGARDPLVPLTRSEEMVDALRQCGGDVRFTVYPDADHDSWTQAYATSELYRWLLEARRRPAN
ncbi:MAG TPA: prolyl oligopeptidase family serine peptidase [Dehalococcoidia bacterium]|nr:prolyl oligopeptidase family serine peptidase [Dehalococcoidia bacterium]